MTHDPTPPPAGGQTDPAAEARARIDDIGTLFSEMKALLERWLAEAGPADLVTGKKMQTKLGEMQTAHLMMLRAEEAFYDKFSDDIRADTIDYDVIRDELGRTLDRIRDAEYPSRPAEGSDGTAT